MPLKVRPIRNEVLAGRVLASGLAREGDARAVLRAGREGQLVAHCVVVVERLVP